ncbi:MAG TPA: glucose-6-phosphate isomerase [Polyangiaceae bacterium]
MNETSALWARYQKRLVVCPSIDLWVDTSRIRYDDRDFERMSGPMDEALGAMAELEKGLVANPDEGRMVGHYWLRAPELAPTQEIRQAIVSAKERVTEFAGDVHRGIVKPARGSRFQNLLVIGIGGSALGPQFVASALGSPNDPMQPFFFDNTDPDGMDRTLAKLGEGLAQTLTIVISKSGATKETRNGMLEAKAAYGRAGLAFEKHAVAVTGEGGLLHRTATNEGWLATFPMWDWVGGRTSELSAVGLLPAALQGFDIDAMLMGARDADAVTRARVITENPSAMLSLMWYLAGGGRGQKAMVVLPYKDRLELFSRYLQQLVMESLGKERDRQGRVVHQGLAVYGNKGSTDQHAYVQQLRDGPDNFFVTFIRVLTERTARPAFEVEPGITSGDYLDGFWLGTRRALYESGRDSLTLTVKDVTARSVGVLIATYERAVGLYASLIGINAYHQPGVEAGKKAAAEILELEVRIMRVLAEARGELLDAQQIADRAGEPDEVESVHHLLERLAANAGRGVTRVGADPPNVTPGDPRAAMFAVRFRGAD